MPLSKTIKIFLASSITELEVERVLLADYINNTVAPIFENGRVHVRLFKCEDDPSGNCGESSQTRFDNELKDSDVSIFLFKKKAGEQTLQEFDLARELQNTKKHEIYVYCFDEQESDKSTELIAFQQRLEKEKIYWKTCDDIDALKAQFLPGLLKYHFGTKSVDFIEQETDTEKSGDARFIEYEANKEKQTRLREAIHKDIENLLQQINSVMADENQNISVRIAKVLDIYKKADRWAAATEYDKEKYYDLLSRYADFLYKSGLYEQARKVYNRQIPYAEEFGENHSDVARIYNNLGSIYLRLGNYNEAIISYNKALAIVKETDGLEHQHTATFYNNIGSVYEAQGLYSEALEYYTKALPIVEKELGLFHSFTATAYNNIGELYSKLGDFPIAMEFLNKSLELCISIHGESHPDTARAYNNIGVVYCGQEEYKKSLSYFQKALHIQEKVLGTDHPETISTCNNIGSVYWSLGENTKAQSFYEKALNSAKDRFGFWHPSTALSYHNIGSIYDKSGDYRSALDYYYRALGIREKVIGVNHPDTAGTYLNMGTVFFNLHEDAEALKYLTKAHNIFSETLGTDHLQTVNAQQWLDAIVKAGKSTNEE